MVEESCAGVVGGRSRSVLVPEHLDISVDMHCVKNYGNEGKEMIVMIYFGSIACNLILI